MPPSLLPSRLMTPPSLPAPSCPPPPQYVGLWHEAHGSPGPARAAVTAAVATPYARLSGDYMADLARVHCLRRAWTLPA